MIPEKDVMQYWKDRAKQQGEATVGFAGHDLEQQDRDYYEKKKFIFQYVPVMLPTLDYGCGIGRYSDVFQDGYLGVDITPELLDYARKLNPTRDYKQLEHPWLHGIEFEFSLFFTATVLQHNDDETVKKIFASLSAYKKEDFFIALYENSQAKAPHVKGRSSDEYVQLVKTQFDVKFVWSYKHKTHGEEHTLTMIDL